MNPETLFTLPLDIPTGVIPSYRRTVANVAFQDLQIGHCSREHHFGIAIPWNEQVFRAPNGGLFVRERLTTEPDGKGDVVTCWMRQS
jgi:hypothetical protein